MDDPTENRDVIDQSVGTEQSVGVNQDLQITHSSIYKQYQEQLDLLIVHSDIKFNFDDHIEIFVDIFQNHNFTNDSNCPVHSNILGVYNCYILKNYEMAVMHWLIACDQTNADAMKNLGNYYMRIEKNAVQALQFYKLACDNGNVGAMYNLGCYYAFRSNNIDMAIKYFTMGIEKGCADSMFNLGQMYYNDREYEKAEKYYMMAFEKDHTRASGCLGRLYYEIKRDNELASMYYLIGFENGDYKFFNDLVQVVRKLNSNELLVRIVKKLLTDGENEMIKKMNIGELTKWKVLYLLGKDGFSNGSTVELCTEFEKNRDIMYLKNKMMRATKFNTLEQCTICLDDNVLCVEMNCGHSICFNCYNPSSKCYYKWCECLR